MKHFYNAVAGVVIGASTLSGQSNQRSSDGQTSEQNVLIQVAAADTAMKFWVAEGRLSLKTLVVDPRPALPTINGSRRLNTEPHTRPAPRPTDVTRQISSALSTRPATTEELTPCRDGGSCKYISDLATLIIGEPLINGDSATIVVGVSVVYEDARGNLRPAATYQSVSLVLSKGVWRAVRMKLAGQG